MAVFGSSLFTRFLAAGPLGDFITQRLRYLILVAAALALVAIVAMAPIAVVRMAGGWHQAMRPGIGTTILRETVSGRMLIIRFSLAVLLVGSCLMSPRLGLRTVVAAGLLLASFALSGHAVADDGARGLVHRGNDIVHLIAAGAWLGSLVPLLPCLAALRRPELRVASCIALRNFSFAGHGAVTLVLVTGVVNALLIAGPPVNWLTPSLYHVLLLSKIALVACMVGLALVNRYVWVPRMKSDMEIAARAMTRRTIAELLLGLGVLALVALFGQLDPG